MESPKRSARRIGLGATGAVVAGLAGAALYLLRLGPAHLSPGNIQWPLAGYDPAMSYLGWHFFRHEPWHWPPGLITGYCAPQGTSIGLVDALPILAIPLKAVSPLLPASFQYLGLWTLLCHVLQGVLAYVLLGAFKPRLPHRLVGAAFFLLLPPFLQRHGHIALASHWLLLAALVLYFRTPSRRCRSEFVPWIALSALAAGIHVYLTAMVLALGTAALLRAWTADRTCGWAGAAAVAAGMAAAVGGMWLIAGNLILRHSLAVAGNFGIYSANLNTFFNPSEMGRLLPKLPTWGQGQYEGFNYLGAGILLLALAVLGISLARRHRFLPSRRHAWLILALLGMAVFAVGNQVAWGDRLLLSISLPATVQKIADAFRAGGRFLWPLVYVLLFLILRTVVRSLPARWSLSLLVLALVVQIADLAPSLVTHDPFRWARYESRLAHPGWERAAAGAAGIRVVPSCRISNGSLDDYKDFGWLAAGAGIPVTAGYAARLDSEAARRFDERLEADAAAGRLEATCLYVLERRQLPWFWAGAPESLAADVWDGYHVLYPRAAWPEHQSAFAAVRRTSLGRYLAEAGDRLLLLAVRDEATANLSEADREVLRGLGSEIDRLGYRHAYLAVVAGGRLLLERFGPDAALDLDLEPALGWPGLAAAGPIHLRSAGFAQGNEARIEVGGRDLAFGCRGFNTVALDSLGRPVEVGCFDTWRGGPGVVISLGSARESGQTISLAEPTIAFRVRSDISVWMQAARSAGAPRRSPANG